MNQSGLYRPEYEHDACGVAFVADLHGEQSRSVVQMGITALENLDHRGAVGAEENSGDGAGILVQVPDEFMRASVPFDLPERGSYAVGIAFLPEEEFAPHIEDGRLVRVLQDWCPPFSGYHLYYPNRRQLTRAMSVLIEALRHPAKEK